MNREAAIAVLDISVAAGYVAEAMGLIDPRGDIGAMDATFK